MNQEQYGKNTLHLGIHNRQDSKLTRSFQCVHMIVTYLRDYVQYILKDYTIGLTAYTYYSTVKSIIVQLVDLHHMFCLSKTIYIKLHKTAFNLQRFCETLPRPLRYIYYSHISQIVI